MVGQVLAGQCDGADVEHAAPGRTRCSGADSATRRSGTKVRPASRDPENDHYLFASQREAISLAGNSV